MQYVADISRPLGATCAPDGSQFRVWAPAAQQVEVNIVGPEEKRIPMTPEERGYWSADAPGVGAGTRYFYLLDGEKQRPDPASRSQPEGVHGPSEVVDPTFDWTDGAWRGIALQKYIMYELHVGAFTEEGTFESAIQRLPDLVDLGVTVIELMPVAQFPGARNWGYDGVLPFAPQNTYGGAPGLKRLVDAAHRAGLAVILDVVYNHLGPEGNYLSDYGPYFTERYRSPWGAALNFDGPGSDEVRRYFIENAVYWLREFHIDALRLDAVHAMLDFSAGTFLEEMAAVVEREAVELNRQVFLIAESDLNDPRVVRTPAEHGFGLDAQWADDLHHALHVLLTGETKGYYEDFVGPAGSAIGVGHLARALAEGVVYAGQYAPSRGRRHGNSFAEIPAHRLIVCTQNHDQVGNRPLGDRLAALVSPAQVKLAAAVLLLSPYLPLIFMGEEYGETNPFLYFISQTEPDLVKAVQAGRKEEFAAFFAREAQAGHASEPPDPAAEETFERSKLNWSLIREGWHVDLRNLYRQLIGLRRTIPALRNLDKESLAVTADDEQGVIAMRRWFGQSHALAACNFGKAKAALRVAAPDGAWCRAAGSGGDGPDTLQVEGGRAELRLAPESFVLYVQGGLK